MDINKLIEQFFEGTLSLEEEETLCNYLRNNEVPPSMQGDKEAVLALCGSVGDCSLPSGAVERLEAMLDELHSNISPAETTERQPSAPIMKKRKIPIVSRVAVAVAASIATLFYLVYDGTEKENADEWAMQEKDTFSSPEEARRCARQAFGELLLAMNTARENTQAIGYTLEESALQTRAIKTNPNE
ncbi:MAG: hypothetical protein IJZ22_03450 [Bacteroidaceae bacterium]|nr:hypothetical protein [Bacteroidaceae bacterium]